MGRRLARIVLFGASVIALWLIALPAMAAPQGKAALLRSPPDSAASPPQASLPEPVVEVDPLENIVPPDPISNRHAAPLCDDRAASTVAPQPILQSGMDTLSSIPCTCMPDVGTALGLDGREPVSRVRGEPARPDSGPSAGASFVLPSSWLLVQPMSTGPRWRAAASSPGRAVHERVERPPRA